MRKITRTAALALSLLAASAAAGAAETVIYKGTGTYTVTRALLPLANGGAALLLSIATVAAIEPSESGFMEGDCAGLSYADAQGSSTLKATCTFDVTTADGFAISIDGDPVGGAATEVLGGRGKFSDATGTGTIRRKFVEGSRGSYEFEFEITTP